MSSSSRKCSGVAHFGTMLALAISTRGANSWVRRTPTGLPLWTSKVSSGAIVRSVSTIASKLRPSVAGARRARRLAHRDEPPPVARGGPRAAVDDEVLGAFGDLGVEVVVQHPQ